MARLFHPMLNCFLPDWIELRLEGWGPSIDLDMELHVLLIPGRVGDPS